MNEEFRIDLDAENFVAGATEATEAMEGFMRAGAKIGALIETIEELGLILAPIIITILALKEALSLTLEAEQIRAVNEQFDLLATNAGVIPEKLKEGMIEAAHGMMTEVEAIEATNKALAKLQTGFEKLPEVMELSRKVAAVMGGSVIERFDMINQAIATGQTRQLAHAGIIIKQEKAYRDYAASIGVAADTLSKAGQQQAMMNAILEAGESKLGGVNADAKEATVTWTQIKVSIKEFGEGFAEMFEKIFGKQVSNALKGINTAIHDMALSMKANFGEGVEASQAKLDTLKRAMEKNTDEISAYQKNANEQEKAGHDAVYNARMEKLFAIRARLANDLDKQIGDTKKLKEAEGESKPGEGGAEASKVDLEKQAAQKAKFNSDMEKLDKQITDAEIVNMRTVAEASQLYLQKRKDETAKIDAEIIKIDAEGNKGQTISRAQADQEIIKLEEIKNQKIRESDENLWKMQNQALKNQVAQSKGAADAIGNSWNLMSKTASHDLQTGIKLADTTTQSFKSHTVSAFKEMGAGTKTASDAMKDAFLGALGDMASEQGEMMLIAGIGTLNPAEAAAGAALIALGGALGGMSSGASSSAGSSGGGGSYSSASPMAQASTQQQTHKSVTLVVQGNILQNDSTTRWITDQVRAAADTQDFKVSSVGGGF